MSKARMMRLAELVLLSSFVVSALLASCNALPGSKIHIARRDVAQQQQRLKVAQPCKNQLSAINNAKQFCINFLNANQVITSTVTTSPLATSTSTKIATSTSTYLTTTTVTPISSVTTTLQPLTTEHDTFTQVSTVTSTLEFVQKRGTQKAPDPFASIISHFSHEIIQDACLIFLYGSLQSPSPKVTTVTKTTATSTIIVTATSTSATTLSSTIISTAPTSTATLTATLSTSTVTTTDATTLATATQTVDTPRFYIQFASKYNAYGPLLLSQTPPGDTYDIISGAHPGGFDFNGGPGTLFNTGNNGGGIVAYYSTGQVLYDTTVPQDKFDDEAGLKCNFSGGNHYGDSGTLLCTSAPRNDVTLNTFYLCGTSDPPSVYIYTSDSLPPRGDCVATTATYTFEALQPSEIVTDY